MKQRFLILKKNGDSESLSVESVVSIPVAPEIARLYRRELRRVKYLRVTEMPPTDRINDNRLQEDSRSEPLLDKFLLKCRYIHPLYSHLHRLDVQRECFLPKAEYRYLLEFSDKRPFDTEENPLNLDGLTSVIGHSAHEAMIESQPKFILDKSDPYLYLGFILPALKEHPEERNKKSENSFHRLMKHIGLK